MLERGYNNKTSSELAGSELRYWCKFRGWTIRILEELQSSGGMTTAELAGKVNCRCTDTKRYCRRLWDAGCVERVERWGWKVTGVGTFLLQLQLKDTKGTPRGHERDTKGTPRQLTLAPYSNPDASEPELAITNLLISHYNATREKFIFVRDPSELAERLELPPEAVREGLAKLRQDGIAYLWWDIGYQMYQLRLKPGFLDRIQHA